MKSVTRLPFPPWFALVLALALSFGASKRAQAAAVRNESGTQLLQAYLPVGTTAKNANCEQLARAVTRATQARRPAAAAIFSAALTRGAKGEPGAADAKFPCACVSRLLSTALAAAPEKASTLLEVATSMYPSCAGSLEALIKKSDDKNVVDGKDAGPTATAPTEDAFDPTVRNNNQPDPEDPSLLGGGFGVGFGPGFPGSPGFTGSPPSGALALPPVQVVVTSVANG